MTQDVNWSEIVPRLVRPFPVEDVEFRVSGRKDANGMSQVVAYIDARLVQERLDEVVGPENWSFDWEPVGVNAAEVMSAKGTLVIFGVAKSDIGTAGNFEKSKGAVSDALKRAAVHWGIGRYLYSLPAMKAKASDGGFIYTDQLPGLREMLPTPDGQPPKQAYQVEAPASRGQSAPPASNGSGNGGGGWSDRPALEDVKTDTNDKTHKGLTQSQLNFAKKKGNLTDDDLQSMTRGEVKALLEGKSTSRKNQSTASRTGTPDDYDDGVQF